MKWRKNFSKLNELCKFEGRIDSEGGNTVFLFVFKGRNVVFCSEYFTFVCVLDILCFET